MHIREPLQGRGLLDIIRSTVHKREPLQGRGLLNKEYCAYKRIIAREGAVR